MKTDTKRKLSLSTSHHISKSPSWENLLDKTKALGFDCLELNVEVPEQFLQKAVQSVEKNDITISSLHNYCPKLIGLPAGRTIYSGYMLTAEDESERKKAVESTKQTIEWAARLNAGAVVIHLGEVSTEPSGRRFAKYIHDFGRKSILYGRYFEEIKKSRALNAKKHMERLMKSMDEFLPLAADRNVLLGLENRCYYNEIPDDGELDELFTVFKGAPIGYWHDTGHAEIFFRNGWINRHTQYLERFKGRVVGMHLHDIINLDDHYAPGCGEFNFKTIVPFIEGNTLLVVEAHSKSSDAQVKDCIDYLASCSVI